MKSNILNDPVKITSLLEDIKSTELKVKVDAIRSLNLISKSLGRERTRNELLPYVTSIIE